MTSSQMSQTSTITRTYNSIYGIHNFNHSPLFIVSNSSAAPNNLQNNSAADNCELFKDTATVVSGFYGAYIGNKFFLNKIAPYQIFLDILFMRCPSFS